MKKTIIAVLALASVVACNKSEVLETTPQKAISFENPFVENSTKAIDSSLTATTFNEFLVYGTITKEDASANIFSGVTVSKNISDNKGTTNATYGTWGYGSQYTQYWVENNDYAFKAIAGVESTAITTDATLKMPTTIEYTATAVDQKDLVYAVNDFGTFNGNVTCVLFNFNHLLSKVKFSFTTDYPKGFDVEVTSVKITNAYASGEYTIDAAKTAKPFGTWTATDNTLNLDFGGAVAADANATSAKLLPITSTMANTTNSCLYEKLLIPANAELEISYSYDVYYSDGTNRIKVNTINKTTTVTVNLQEGCSYNFTGKIPQAVKPITFTVESLGSWATTTDTTVQY